MFAIESKEMMILASAISVNSSRVTSPRRDQH
jgi:hypothetical protein